MFVGFRVQGFGSLGFLYLGVIRLFGFYGLLQELHRS